MGMRFAMLAFLPALLWADDLGDLRRAFESAVSALNARNLEAFTANIHPQALSFYSCYPTSGKEGKEACSDDWGKFFASSETAQYRVIGATGLAWGQYNATVTPKGKPQTTYAGRYALVFTKADGRWMIVWQENSPASPQK